MFLGYLLARAGIDVIVLEKHGDFLRDFRGDTIHPSTFEVLSELGLLDRFLPLVDFRAQAFKVSVEGTSVVGPDFSHLDGVCNFVGFVPQWDLLNFLTEAASTFSSFDLRMNTRAFDLVRQDGRVVGVRCEAGGKAYDIHADLVVAADGRSSTLRSAAKMTVEEIGVPIDVLWFRLDRPANDEGHTLAWLRDGHALITIPRKTHYQVAMVIQKGAFDGLKGQGLEAFRTIVSSVCPPLAEPAASLTDWGDVKLLSVQINRLPRWYEDGLLFIGDAAHAMSPVGGVGINLAIQDAVATANQLIGSLRSKTLSVLDLQAIQLRREPAARKTQRLQRLAHAQLFGSGRGPVRPFAPAWYVRLGARLLAPWLRRLGARWIGAGFQPEHVSSALLTRRDEPPPSADAPLP